MNPKCLLKCILLPDEGYADVGDDGTAAEQLRPDVVDDDGLDAFHVCNNRCHQLGGGDCSAVLLLAEKIHGLTKPKKGSRLVAKFQHCMRFACNHFQTDNEIGTLLGIMLIKYLLAYLIIYNGLIL